MICVLPHHLPREETLLIDKQPWALSRGTQQKLLGEETGEQSSVFQGPLAIRLCANKSGDTSMAFTLNKLLFHRRTGQVSGNRLSSEVLGTTGECIQGSCSSILVLSNLSHGCKGKRDTILEGPGDKERFGSHCVAVAVWLTSDRYPLAPCEAHTLVEQPTVLPTRNNRGC